jgi:hypothetical protein
MPDVPTENSLEQKPLPDAKKGECEEHNKSGGESTDFTPLIDAIAAEGRAYRKEEQREDRGKERREWITIALIFVTFVAVCYQVHEMIKVYEPIKAQAEASVKQADAAKTQADLAKDAATSTKESVIEASRAWVGPSAATINGTLSIGKDSEVVIIYQNTGRQPAVGFSPNVRIYVETVKEDAEGLTGKRIESALVDCQLKKPSNGTQVVYPTTGFGGSQIRSKFDKSMIDDDVIKGDKILIAMGCFSYETFGIAHNSAFCFFYRNGMSPGNDLNFCSTGNYAD